MFMKLGAGALTAVFAYGCYSYYDKDLKRIKTYQAIYGDHLPVPDYCTRTTHLPQPVPEELPETDRELWALARMMVDEQDRQMKHVFENGQKYTVTGYPDRKARKAKGRFGYTEASNVTIAVADRLKFAEGDPNQIQRDSFIKIMKDLGYNVQISIDKFPDESDPTSEDIYFQFSPDN